MITIRNLTLRRGTKVVLQQANLTLNPGEKIGLVGRNGAGKTTLTPILAGITTGLIALLGFALPPLLQLAQVTPLRALRRLSDQGLVHVEAAGRAHLYRLNRDHVLTAPLIEMASATTRLRHQLADRVSTWQVPALHVSLYGSVARGEATSSSDVDVLVVRPESLDPAHVGIWEDQLAALEIEVYSWTGNHLSWLDTTLKLSLIHISEPTRPY